MRTYIHLKFVSSVLMFVMLTVTLHGIHESAHAMQGQASISISTADAAVPHDPPCTPFEHHQDYDGCDSCVNCACHASLTIQPLQLSYNPVITELQPYDPFRYLPEVYLTRFIPPQITA